jgi:WD40 repeat protein
MGVVYKARHRELNRFVALKMLRGTTVADPEFRDRFRIEAEAVAQLQHPNIIQVFEIGMVEPTPGSFESRPFIALEYVDGVSLARLTVSPQTPLFAARMVEKLARAAHAAHQVGVIHRDLKPANVLLTSAGDPKIADFGVAKQIGAERDSSGRFVTQIGFAVGTPEYMAPEQVAGEVPTPAIDIYALGVILYELLTARVPFQAPSPNDTMYLVRHQEPVSPRRLQPSLPRDLETICLKCLAKAPNRRYESAEALANDLARWADGKTILARPIGPTGRAIRWARRNPTIAALSLAVVVVALIGLTGVLVNWREARTQADAAIAAGAKADARAFAERWERYRADIIAASSALQLHNVAAAQRALDAAPEERRDWEWKYFSQRLDTARDVLGGDGGNVHWALISANGKTVTLVDDGDTARFWDVPSRQRISVCHNVSEMGRSGISPDGLLLAYHPSSPQENILILRDIRADSTKAILRGHEKGITSFLFNPDGSQVAAGCLDGMVRIWETATGKEVLVLKAQETPVGVMDFSVKNRLLAVPGTSAGTIRLWNFETGQLHSELRAVTGTMNIAKFSPNGELLLGCSGFPVNKLWLWNVREGTLIAELSGHTNSITGCVFSPDGSRLATSSRDQSILLWESATGQLVREILGHTGWVNSVAFSPDGRRLVSASSDKTVRLWDGKTGKSFTVLHGHTDEVLKADFSADGNTIISCSRDRTVRLWDARRSEDDNTLKGHRSFVYGVAFHPDGNRVASTSWDGTVRIWDANTGRPLSVFKYEQETIVTCVAFHPDGQILASVGRDNAVRLWDLSTGREIQHWALPTNHWHDTRLAFSPQGDLLACGSKDGGVRLWNMKDRSEVAVLRGHRGAVRDVAFSPDGRWLVSAAEPPYPADPTVPSLCVWDVAKKEIAQVLPGHKEGAYSLAFNHAGTLLATGSEDKTIQLWETATWESVDILRPGSKVYGLTFSKDDRRLASACADNTIRFWDVVTRQEVAELHGHGNYVHSIAFSPDGTRLVSGSGDNTLRIWDTLPSRDRER